MTDIQQISNDGFVLKNAGLALLSLKISLKAFFSTFQSMKYQLHIFSPEYKKYDLKEADFDYLHSLSYSEACTEAIVHFHHFVELVCKDILREEHPLLADYIRKEHVILFKLLKEKSISEDDAQNLRTIDFSQTLERLCSLINSKLIHHHEQLVFISEAKRWLDKLSELRNRLLHRGIFVLRYPALDKLFGKYAFPFIEKVISLDKYSGMERFWKYARLKCGADPIKIIIDEFKNSGNEDYNLGKIAFLKELGRAAYEQPRVINFKAKEIGDKKYRPFTLDIERQQRAVRIAKAETANVIEVRSCPVCGVPSLVVYDDIEVEGENHYHGTYEKAWRYTWQVVCMCCTFEVNHHLRNPKEYNLPIDDFWYGEELE